MSDGAAYLFTALICLLLMIPIREALNTLLALRRRTVYPLLRVRMSGGTTVALNRLTAAQTCSHCGSPMKTHTTFLS